MKTFNNKFIISGAIALAITAGSCKNFLDKSPQGTLNTTVLANKAGVDGLLIGAYSLLDGVYEQSSGSPWTSGTDNWVFGGVGADDAHKGSTPSDQLDAGTIESHTATSVNGYLNPKFLVMLNGIQRANDVLREIPMVKDGSVTAAYATQVTGEAKFLRAFFHMELAKLWRNVPYVDETITYDNGNYNVANPGPIWDKIEADLTAAVAALPATQAQIGRANKYAAEAFLGKAYMYDHKYSQALTAFNDCITNGVTSSGAKYALVSNFADNFNALKKNNSEGVFVIQASVKDGSNGFNGNGGDVLNFGAGGPATCCGFNDPTFDLVNVFKVDAVTGLPLFGTYNASNLSNDQAVPASSVWSSTAPYKGPSAGTAVTINGVNFPKGPGDAVSRPNPANPNVEVTYVALSDNTGSDPLTNPSVWAKVFTEDAITPLDPRLDWSVGRKGIPFLDWGDMPGAAWARDQANSGPYIPIKSAYYKAAAATTSDAYGGWAPGQSTANGYNAMRYSDLLLMAAECEVEVGSLTNAQNLVNQVRTRASNVSGYVVNSDGSKAANYKVGLYTTQFAANGKAYARTAVQFERRIELAMEGHRFFDLQRWDGIFGGPMATGFMATTLNAYIATEKVIPNFTSAIIQVAKFTQGRNELYPIPQGQIDVTNGTIKQNPGY